MTSWGLKEPSQRAPGPCWQLREGSGGQGDFPFPVISLSHVGPYNTVSFEKSQ